VTISARNVFVGGTAAAIGLAFGGALLKWGHTDSEAPGTAESPTTAQGLSTGRGSNIPAEATTWQSLLHGTTFKSDTTDLFSQRAWEPMSLWTPPKD
jgi:hypothetical protein